MTKIYVKLTDGSGDDGYAVILTKEASIWEDNSSADHEINSITQSGNVSSGDGNLNCEDGHAGTALLLIAADWSITEGRHGDANRKLDIATPTETDWAWEVTQITT